MAATIRAIHPSDYRPVISVIDDWWGDGTGQARVRFIKHLTT